MDSDIDEKTKHIVEKMIWKDQNRQEFEQNQQINIFKRKKQQPEFIEENGQNFINGRQLLEDLIKDATHQSPKSKTQETEKSSNELTTQTPVDQNSSGAHISLNSLIDIESSEKNHLLDRVRNISLVEFNGNCSFEPSESSHSKFLSEYLQYKTQN